MKQLSQPPQVHRQLIDPTALLSKAVGLYQAGSLHEAEQIYRTLLTLQPDNVIALNYLGTIRFQLGYSDEGIQLMEKAITLKPDFAEAHYDRGVALMNIARYREAVASFESAIAFHPDDAEANWNKCLLKLLLGEYGEGWKLYEWRWKRQSQRSARPFPQPLWLGEELPAETTILLHAEQGYGDTIQFCRYVPLAARMYTVIFECFETLVPLMQYNFPNVRVVGMAADYPGITGVPKCDFHAPLLSLPFAFRTTLATVPPAPYLRAEPEFMERWRSLLDKTIPRQSSPFRIGICWAGEMRQDRPDCVSIDARRSIKFKQLKPLFDIPNVVYVSLQLGQARSELDDDKVKDFSSEIQTWSDTAAIISLLDLVISVDTSVVHLAAAMGKRTFLLNRFDTCWRWLLHRDDSPWYPSLTQFRQKTPGDWAEVIERVKTAIPTVISISTAALLSQAVGLYQAGNLQEAEQIYRTLLVSEPENVIALNFLGTIRFQLGYLEQGITLMEKAIAIKPDYAEAHYDRGVALMNIARYSDALTSFEKAVDLHPDDAEANWNKCLLKLLLGEYEEGWRLYEWRWKRHGQKSPRTFPQALWLGGPIPTGKTILLHAEQGFGDAIQFCRYVPMVTALGAKVLLEVPASLLELVSTLRGSFQLVKSGTPLPSFDLHCPLSSLPLALGTTVDTIPNAVPYIFADVAKQETWRNRLGAKTRPRVGLVWSGSASHYNDRNRSIALDILSPLLSSDYEFHSLQTEVRPEDAFILANHAEVKSHGSDLLDFSDTAALTAEMDLVISVDTSVAHLAGALGKQVWILLPFLPDFRWMAEGHGSPWYPTARLFRQSRSGDWCGVIANVKAELEHI